MNRNNNNNNNVIMTTSFLAGCALTSLLHYYYYITNKKQRRNNNHDHQHRIHSGSYNEYNDTSMFYGSTKKDHDMSTYISKDKQYLPKELYSQVVRNTVVVCVDTLIVKFNVHTKRYECLLVERADEPAKNLWWLPGGRLYKGETFFDGALRKVKEETGLKGDESSGTTITPIQVLGFYNTFFPTSSWDTETEKGTQTVQPIVLVKIETTATANNVNGTNVLSTNTNQDILLDRTSERYRWIGLSSKEAIKNGEDRYVVDALLKFEAWNATYGSTSGITI